MKKVIILSFVLISAFHFNGYAQEKFGNTLNLGVGIGGYSYGRAAPVFHANFELDVAKNFTLAPFVSFYTYSSSYYWPGNKNYAPRYYTYRETVVPVGVKGSYYFDQLLGMNSKWDLYAAGSVGFAIVNSSYVDDRYGETYYGDRNYYAQASALYLALHIGGEYHFNSKLGMYLDLSSSLSTIGLAIHFGSSSTQ